MTKAKSKTVKNRGGRHGMILELSEDDRSKLLELVERYLPITQRPNKVFVIRQLIRNAAAATKLPPVIGGAE